MNVPFISSGALSRNHYTLVRKVEDSNSEDSVSRILDAEVKSIREQLARPNLPPRRLKEALIILLYCNMAAPASIFPRGTFDFALLHGLNLAEAGITIEDKRTGYLFCAEMMEPNHEMRLMLVNTLRKDLEHSAISRICLALDNIIHVCSAHVIPATQRLLPELLSHNNASVRRRALYAARALSKYEPDLLGQFYSRVLRGLKDPEMSVTAAALRVAETLFTINPQLSPAIQDVTNEVLESYVEVYSATERGVIVVVLETLRIIGLRTSSVSAAFDLLVSSSSGHDRVVLMGLYHLFTSLSQATLHAAEERTQTSLVGTVRSYLMSGLPNEAYLFLSCLECLSPGLWAGTSEDIPSALEEREVEQIMQFLDSNDDLIRKKTLHLLGRVDEGVLNAYYFRAVALTTRAVLPLKDLNARTKRLLEILDVTSGENGELYAGQIKWLLSQIEAHITGNGIIDSAIEGILLRLRAADLTFQVPCAATMLAILCNGDVEIGPTMTIILAALVTEYSHLVSLSPAHLLSGICRRLLSCLLIVQEPCLLAMLRLAADCEEIPKQVTQTVSKVAQNASRHIRHRCDQFLTLTSGRREVLLGIVGNSKSLALPDFLEALEIHSRNLPRKDVGINSRAKSLQTSAALSRTSLNEASTSKLWHEATVS